MRDFLIRGVSFYAVMQWGVVWFAYMEPRDVPIDRLQAMGEWLFGLIFAAVLAIALWVWGKLRP